MIYHFRTNGRRSTYGSACAHVQTLRPEPSARPNVRTGREREQPADAKQINVQSIHIVWHIEKWLCHFARVLSSFVPLLGIGGRGEKKRFSGWFICTGDFHSFDSIQRLKRWPRISLFLVWFRKLSIPSSAPSANRETRVPRGRLRCPCVTWQFGVSHCLCNRRLPLSAQRKRSRANTQIVIRAHESGEKQK